MHAAAMEWIGQYASEAEVRVLDVGGRHINGSPVDLFPNAEYQVIDLMDGDNVDWVGDIMDFDADDLGGEFDVIVYAEVAEHTPDWAAHLPHMFDMLADDGVLVVTAAGPNRVPHSAHDGGAMREGEFYQNLEPEQLADELYNLTDYVIVDVFRNDVRAMAGKP